MKSYTISVEKLDKKIYKLILKIYTGILQYQIDPWVN